VQLGSWREIYENYCNKIGGGTMKAIACSSSVVASPNQSSTFCIVLAGL